MGLSHIATYIRQPLEPEAEKSEYKYMREFEALIQECDAHIRTGQAHEAAKRLSGLNTARVPRDWRLPLARICRRAGLSNIGITLLNRVVHPRRSKNTAGPSANELAEYGMLLYRIGATDEANDILKHVDRAQAPEVLQYQALVHMTKWEFPEAIAALNKFLAVTPEGYLSLVGRTNLALAHVESRNHDIAAKILDENVKIATEQGQKRMLSTNLAYRAQLHVQEQDFAAARRDIELGELSLESALTSDRQQFLKWKLILAALENERLEPLEELKAVGLESRNWEDIRLADLYSCRIKFDLKQFLHLIFGTPFPGFRQRICQEVGQLPARHLYVLGPKSAPRMDIRTGEIDGVALLPPGRKCHQLIEVLLRDFYQPLRLAGLFSGLFPGHHFDPASSPGRTHQILNRTRRWLNQSNIPLEILERGGFYSLQITGDFSFRIPLERQPVEGMHLHFEKLKTTFAQAETFSAREAREKLSVSRQTLQRIVNWGLEGNKLERLGSNRETEYRLKKAA